MINENDIRDMWTEHPRVEHAFARKHPPQQKPGWNGPLVSSANEKQVAGDHYKKYGELQPWDVITAWGLGYLDGTALKYIARWRDKGGIDDIRKAIHFLEKFIEVEEAKNVKS